MIVKKNENSKDYIFYSLYLPNMLYSLTINLSSYRRSFDLYSFEHIRLLSESFLDGLIAKIKVSDNESIIPIVKSIDEWKITHKKDRYSVYMSEYFSFLINLATIHDDICVAIYDQLLIMKG